MAQVTAQNANLQAGEWHHVAFTLDMENKKVLLWVNNMNVASTVVDESSIPTFSASTNVKLGSDGTSQFEGLMDNIVIYEKNVSDEELKQIMNYRDPELYLKKALESYITFDKFRTNMDAEGVVIDTNVVSEGERVNDFSNKSVRISAPSPAPIVKTNSEINTESMSVGSWIKPVSVTERDMEIFGKDGVFSLGVKQGGEMTFELGNEDISTKQFVVHKDKRETVTTNSGSLSFPETAAARAEATLASGSYFASEFTMSMWFKVDSFATTRTLMSGIGFSTESSNKGLCVENGSLYLYDASNTLIVQVGNIVADQWYHLVLTDESLLLNYRKYEYTKSPIWTNDKVLKLGNNYSNNKNFLGHIDEFVLYTKRLDPLAIYDLFKGTYPSKFESLVVVKYEFDDSGTPGKDSGSAGIDLTLTSATHSTAALPFESKIAYAPMRGPDGIISTHYDFVDDVTDSSGNQNDALNEQNITFVNSFNNVSYRAAEFDGATSKINCPPQILSDMDDGFTTTTWIQLPEVLTPNTRYPIFAQEGVMMAWLQTDDNLTLSTKVYISPKTDFMIKEAVWNTDSVDVTMSIKSVSADRIYYAALMLKKLDLSVAEDVQALNNAFVQMGVAPQSNTTTEFTFSLTEATGIDGTNYSVSMIDNAYLYMRVVGDVYDLSSAKNVTLYQNVLPMFDSSVRNFVYTSTAPLHNFEALTMTNSAVNYVTDTVFSEEKYVAEYTGKSTHNVTFTPQNDFVLDVVFKQTRAGTEERHGVLELVTSAGTALLYVAHADYWRFNYVPTSGTVAATQLYAEGATTGMYPAFNEWGRHTYVFRKQTGQVEFYYNGVKGNVVAENAEATIVDGTTNVFTLATFNPFDVANTLKIGYANTGPQTDGTRIASVDVILDDQAFPEFATPAEVRSQSYTPTYTLDYSSGTVANSFPTKSGTVQVLDPEGYRLGVVEPPFYETLTHNIKLSVEQITAADGTVVGNSGVTTTDGTTYSTTNVGEIGTDVNGRRYVKFDSYTPGANAFMVFPSYAASTDAVSHTFYHVVSSNRVDGQINSFIGTNDTSDTHAIDLNNNDFVVWPFVFSGSTWPIPTDMASIVLNNYVIVVFKVQYVSAGQYRVRVKVVGKNTDGTESVVEKTEAQYSTWDGKLFPTQITIGWSHPSNYRQHDFNWYETGVIDNFVSDTEFDAIVENLKAKYYAPFALTTTVLATNEIEVVYRIKHGDSTNPSTPERMLPHRIFTYLIVDETTTIEIPSAFMDTFTPGDDWSFVRFTYVLSGNPQQIRVAFAIEHNMKSPISAHLGDSSSYADVGVYGLEYRINGVVSSMSVSSSNWVYSKGAANTIHTIDGVDYTKHEPIDMVTAITTTATTSLTEVTTGQGVGGQFYILTSGTTTGGMEPIPEYPVVFYEGSDVKVHHPGYEGGFYLSTMPLSMTPSYTGETKAMVKQVAYNPINQTQVVFWEAYPLENPVTDMYVVLLHPDLAITESFPTGVISDQNSGNASKVATDVGAVFDFTPVSGSTTSKMGSTILNNGDTLYGNFIGHRTGTGQIVFNIGKLFDGTTPNEGDFLRPNGERITDMPGYARLEQFIFYYEPSETKMVNSFSATIYRWSGGDDMIKELGVYDNGTLTPISLEQYVYTGAYDTLETGTVTFDPVSIGPGKPLKIVMGQTNDTIRFSEMKLENTYAGIDSSAPVGDGSITRGDYELHQFVLSNPTNAAVQRYNTTVPLATNYGQFSEFGSALTNMDGTTAPVDGDTQYVAKALLFDSSFAPVENVGYVPVGKQAILFQKNAFSTVESFNLTHQDVWTVAFWYKTKATLTDTMYYAISWGSTSRRTIEFNTGGFNFRTGQGHRFDYNFVNDQWYHIAFTSTSGGIQNDTLTVYINGVVLPATSGGTQNPSAYTLPSKLALGMGVYNGATDDSWFSPVPYNSFIRNALMTDVMMFDSTLAAADIAAMYNNTFDPSTSSTIIMHLMPSSDALSVVDSTGNFTVEVHKYSPDVTMIVPYEPASDYGLTTAPNAVIFQNTPLSTIDEVLTSTTLAHRDEWSFSFWYKSTAAFQATTDGTEGSYASYIVQWKGDTSGHRAIELRDGKVNMRTGQGHEWDFEFEVGRWYHVAFTSTSGDIQANTLFFYVDGVLIPTASGGINTPNAYNFPSKLNIGYGDSMPHYNGTTYLMSDFLFYNTTLTPEEVNANFSQQQYTFGTKTPLLHYRFASESTKLHDSSGNGFHLEPTTDGNGIAPEIIPTFMDNLQVPSGIIVASLAPNPQELLFHMASTKAVIFYDINSPNSYTVDGNNNVSQLTNLSTLASGQYDGVINTNATANINVIVSDPKYGKHLLSEFSYTVSYAHTNVQDGDQFYVFHFDTANNRNNNALITSGMLPANVHINYWQSVSNGSTSMYIGTQGHLNNSTYQYYNGMVLLHIRMKDNELYWRTVNKLDSDDSFNNYVRDFVAQTVTAADFENFGLYGYANAASSHFKNKVYEFMYFEKDQLTDAERDDVYNLLMNKYMATDEDVVGSMPSEYNLVGKYTGTDAHTVSFTPPYDYLVDLTVNADSAQKVMDLQYGAETVSLNAADPWTLSGSFGEVSLEPFVDTWQSIRFEGEADTVNFPHHNDASIPNQIHTGIFFKNQYNTGAYGESETKNDYTITPNDGHFRGAFEYLVFESPQIGDQFRFAVKLDTVQAMEGDYAPFSFENHWSYNTTPNPNYGYLPGSTTTAITDGTGLVSMGFYRRIKSTGQGNLSSEATWGASSTGYVHHEFTLIPHANGDTTKFSFSLRVHDGEGTDLANFDDISVYEFVSSSYTFGSINSSQGFTIGEPLIFRDCMYFTNDNRRVVGVATKTSLANPSVTSIASKYQWWRLILTDIFSVHSEKYYRGAEIGLYDTMYTQTGSTYTLVNNKSVKMYYTGVYPRYGSSVDKRQILTSDSYSQVFDGTLSQQINIDGTNTNSATTHVILDFEFSEPVSVKHIVFTNGKGGNGSPGTITLYHATEHASSTDAWTLHGTYTNTDTSDYDTLHILSYDPAQSNWVLGTRATASNLSMTPNFDGTTTPYTSYSEQTFNYQSQIFSETMNRFTLVARAATDSMEVYHDGLPAVVTKVSGTTTVTDNSFTLGSDPTAQEVTLVIGGDSNGELLVESCDVVQSTQIITSFADPTYVAEKQWALTYTQPIALDNVTPADTVLGWGKFDYYLKSEGTKLQTGIEVEMWKDYFQVPVENVWGTDTWMIIKTIDGKYYGVGSNQYGQMGMPYQDMASMTDAANVAESYYFKVPVELTHFAAYDIKKMVVRQKSTMFLTTDGKLYGMGGTVEYSHFGTGDNPTALYTITHLATDKVITDFSQSGSHTLILTTDNKLYNTGENRRCAIGDGTTTDRSTFVNVASAITNTEIVKSVYTTDHMQSGFFTESNKVFVCGWEYGNCYHMGNSDTNIASFTETGFSDGRKIKQFFMTPIRTWMVDENNDIYVGGNHYENTNGWPSGVFGPSGYTSGPTLIDSSINDGTEVIDILDQSTTGIVVVRAGGVYAFGRNTDGRLGNGDAVTTTTTTRAYKIADQHPIVAFITTGVGPYMLIGYRTMAAIAPTLTDMDKITDVNTIGMDYGAGQVSDPTPFVAMDSFSALDNLINITGAVYSEHTNIEKIYLATFDVSSPIEENITNEALIALIESADVPANAKYIGGPVDRYVPTSVNVNFTHTYSDTGTSTPIVLDMMVYAYMLAVDTEGRVGRQFRLTGRKNRLVLGNTQEEILREITFVNEYGQVSTWEEKSSRFTITSHITMKIGEDGIYFHNHPIFMQGNWTVIYWAYTGPDAEASGMVTQHPTAPAEVSWPLGQSINEPYKYNTVELAKYDSQTGNNQSWEWFGVYSGDGTYQSDGWSGRYESSSVRYTSWIQVGLVHDAVAKTMTAYHIRSPGNYTTYALSNVTFTTSEGYLRIWRKYINNNGTLQIDGVRILNNEVLTPEQISQDTRTTSQFSTVV